MNTTTSPGIANVPIALQIIKTADKTIVKPGEKLTYTITVTNDGPDTANTPTVSDQIPSALELPQYSLDNGTTWNPWNGSITLPDLAAGTKTTVLIQAAVRKTATGTFNNTAAVTSKNPESDGTTAPVTSAPITTNVTPTSDLMTAVTVDNDNPIPGDTVTYTVTTKNNGPAAAQTPTVSYTPPSQLTAVEYSTDGGSTWVPWTGTTTRPNLPNGGTDQILIRGKVDNNTTTPISSTIKTTSPNNDPNTADNTVTTVTPVKEVAKLSAEKLADKTVAKPGEMITYGILILNDGPAAAKTPTLSDKIHNTLENPEYLTSTNTAWAPWTGNATLPDIAADDGIIVLIRGTLRKNTPPGELTNVATVTSPTLGTDGTNKPVTSTTAHTHITPVSDLSTTITGNNENPKPGDTVTYTVTVKNNGPAAAPTPTVTYNPPPQMTNAEYSDDGGSTWAPWTGTTTLSNLPNGGTDHILIRGKIDDSTTGIVTNTVITTSPNEDPNPGDNTAISTVPVKEVANVTAQKTADKTVARPGEVLTYTITIKNGGPGTAKAPTVTDKMRDAIENPQYSLDGGKTWAPWTGSTVLGDLPADASAAVLTRGTISKNTPPGSLTNTATVTTATPGKDGTATPVTSTTAKTDVTPVANLVTTVTPDKDNPIPGDDITYLITVKNNGPAAAAEPEISFRPPRGLSNVEYSKDGGLTWQLWDGSTILPNIPNGGTEMLLVRGNVNGDTSNITTDITTRSVDDDPTAGGNKVSTTTPVKATAGLVITKACDAPVARPGDPITYTITVTNSGPAAAKAPIISDSVPDTLETPQYSTDNGATWAPWTGSITLPDLSSGTRTALLIRGNMSKNSAVAIANTATVTSVTPGRDGAATPVASAPVITNVMPTADLTPSITVNNDNPHPGDQITYTITIKNNGPSSASEPSIRYTPPDQLSDVESSRDGGLTWRPWDGLRTIRPIDNGGSGQLLIRGNVVNNATGNITSTVQALSSETDPVRENNTASIVTPISDDPVNPETADVSIRKTADRSTAKSGETIIYTITVSNNGPAAAKAPTISDLVPAALENPLYSTSNGTVWYPWNDSITLSDVAAGTSASVLIKGTISRAAAGSLSNTATVTTKTPGKDGTTTPVTTPPATTGITPSADLATTVAVDNPTPKPGDELTYTVTVKNNGPATAQTPSINYTPPGNLKDVEYSTDGGKTFNPWTGTTTLNNISDGGTNQIQIRGKIDGDQPNVTSTIIAAGKEDDPNPGNNSVTTTTPVNQEANIATAVTVDKETLKPGDSLTYTVTVINNGPATAQTPAITYQPPRSLTNVEYSKDGGKTWLTWTGNTTLDNIPKGGTTQVLIRGNVDGSTTGTVTSTITAAPANKDPDLSDNSVTLNTPVTAAAPSSDILTAVTIDNPAPKPDDRVTYTVTVKNNGPDAAQAPAVSYQPPRSLTNVEYSKDGGKTWLTWTGNTTLDNIPKDGTTQVLIRGNVDSSTIGTVTSAITAVSANKDPDPSNNSVTINTPITTVTLSSDIAAAITIDNPAPKPGDRVTYTVTVKNNGPDAAQAPTVSYQPPRSLTNVEYSKDGGKTWLTWTGNTTLDNIPKGSTTQLLIRGKIDNNTVGNLVAEISASSANSDPNPANNTSTIISPVTSTANLTITKSADPLLAAPGSSVTYTIQLTNNGPGTAKAPTVTDKVPDAIENPQYYVYGGSSSWTPWQGSITLPDLTPNKAVTMVIQGRIKANAKGTVSNIASVSASIPGTNGSTAPVSTPPATINVEVPAICSCTVQFCSCDYLFDCCQIPYNTPVAAPADPCRPNCTFGGWFTDQHCLCRWNFNSPVVCDMILYAKWLPCCPRCGSCQR